MRIMVKRYSNTVKVQYDWIELDTDSNVFNSGNSAIKQSDLIHDMAVEVKTQKEFDKQERAMKEYARNMFNGEGYKHD